MNALFDLARPAENGLRRGYTTGSCATAAVKAALLALLCNEWPEEVRVSLPDEVHDLVVPIDRMGAEEDGAVRADVIKDGGDDPDQTHRARIFVRVRRNGTGGLGFKRGEGVGLVTQPGLRLGIGEPAINPVPRAMMAQAVREVLEESDGTGSPGFDLEIGCENGAEIAKRTFNPRLGIEGGISILGTTGIVEPKSMAAFQASIETYVRVALGDRPEEIVLAPGNLGQRFARSFLRVPVKGVVQMSNFVGFAIECVERTLAENEARLARLWVVGHPGKLAKVLDGAWMTHSGESRSAVAAIYGAAVTFGLDAARLKTVAEAKTVEGVIELFEGEAFAPRFWSIVEKRLEVVFAGRLPRVDCVAVRLFKMDGTALGGTV